MVSSGQHLIELWAEHKDALTIMALKELSDADVSKLDVWFCRCFSSRFTKVDTTLYAIS